MSNIENIINEEIDEEIDENIINDNHLTETTKEPIKLKRGRKKIHENIKQYYKEIGYHKEYYKRNNKHMICPICNRETTTNNFVQHTLSKSCKNIHNKDEERLKLYQFNNFKLEEII